MRTHKYPLWALSALALGLVLLPEAAQASSTLYELSTPLEAFVGAITGKVGRWVSIIGMALIGIYYILNREDMSGPVKYGLGVVFAITFLAFAKSMVDAMFSFSGAVL